MSVILFFGVVAKISASNKISLHKAAPILEVNTERTSKKDIARSTFLSGGSLNLNLDEISEFFAAAGGSAEKNYFITGSGFSPSQIVTIEVADASSSFTVTSQTSGYNSTIQIMADDAGQFDEHLIVRFAPSDELPHTATISHLASGMTTQSFDVQGNPDPMPLSLLSFTGKLFRETVELEWKVNQKKSNSFFDVELANPNFGEFHRIGRVELPGRNDGLNSTFTFDYPVPNSHSFPLLFRLKTIDGTGKKNYSKVIAVGTNNVIQTNVEVVPNPFVNTSQLKIRSPKKGKVDVHIFNLNGRKLYSTFYEIEKGLNTINLPLIDHFPPGFYTLLTQIEGVVNQIKLVKEN